jgi:hypothetical protein
MPELGRPLPAMSLAVVGVRTPTDKTKSNRRFEIKLCTPGSRRAAPEPKNKATSMRSRSSPPRRAARLPDGRARAVDRQADPRGARAAGGVPGRGAVRRVDPRGVRRRGAGGARPSAPRARRPRRSTPSRSGTRTRCIRTIASSLVTISAHLAPGPRSVVINVDGAQRAWDRVSRHCPVQKLPVPPL